MSDWEQLLMNTGVGSATPPRVPRRSPMPKCVCGRFDKGRFTTVEPDAFGRPTDKCVACRDSIVRTGKRR